MSNPEDPQLPIDEQKENIMETLTSWEREGMEKGLEKATQSIALNMLRKNMDLETIAELTGLTIDQLQQLQADNL